jgi:hypothetical protein
MHLQQDAQLHLRRCEKFKECLLLLSLQFFQKSLNQLIHSKYFLYL